MSDELQDRLDTLENEYEALTQDIDTLKSERDEAEARAEAAEQQAARLMAAAMLYLEGYALYFTTSGDDVPQKQMAEARRQMRAILEIEDQYPDRAALAASQPAPAVEANS